MELKGYTNIPDWMLSLDLDVYETIILAVIYGFSQDGESTFAGSQSYLAKKARCSKRKVGSVLPHLVDLGLIEKIDCDVQGVHLCKYRVCTRCIGYAQDAIGGIAQGATNNIDKDNIDNKRENKGQGRFNKPSVQEVAEYCRERNNGIDPEEFVAFYESKGWMVGKNPMKDWRSAIITWEKSKKKEYRPRPQQRKESAFSQQLRMMDSMYGTNYHQQAYGRKEDCDEQ